MSVMYWLAVGFAVAALYPFGAGMTYRALGPRLDKPPLAPKPDGLFHRADECGCTHHCGYDGVYTEPCEWHAAHSKAMAAGTVWPLYWTLRCLFRTTAILLYALHLVPRAMFRLGARRLAVTHPGEP